MDMGILLALIRSAIPWLIVREVFGLIMRSLTGDRGVPVFVSVGISIPVDGLEPVAETLLPFIFLVTLYLGGWLRV